MEASAPARPQSQSAADETSLKSNTEFHSRPQSYHDDKNGQHKRASTQDTQTTMTAVSHTVKSTLHTHVTPWTTTSAGL
jgi:hypothetical protein